MLKLTVLLSATLLGLGASSAEAHLVSKSNAKENSLQHIAKSQKQNLAHSRYVCNEGRRHIKKWHCKSIVWLKKELKQTLSKLEPKPVIVGLGPLSCIGCWERVASCESGGNWNISTGNGFYGGLQFLQSTWESYGGTRYAPTPNTASKMQQIAIASYMSLSHWPHCGSYY
jgi:transglycosylase-like protein